LSVLEGHSISFGRPGGCGLCTPELQAGDFAELIKALPHGWQALLALILERRRHYLAWANTI
jgi:hypothetical protein